MVLYLLLLYISMYLSFLKITRENTDKFNCLQPLALLSKMYQSINRLLCFLLLGRKSVKVAILWKAAESWRNSPFTT